MNRTTSRSRPARPAERGPGIFVPQYVIAVLTGLALGIAAGVLVWLLPAMWPPIDAALAVTGLSLTLYGVRRGSRRP